MKAIILALSLAATAHAANWPSWRGPHNDGTCDETGLPMKWSATENIAWKTALPGPGNSTPVVWGDKVFITQSLDNGARRVLLCFDKKTGVKRWEAGTTGDPAETTHKTNPHCSGSPATDGERVIVTFGSAGVFCYDMAGKELWRRDLGPQFHIWGPGTSPVIVGDMVFLNHGPSVNARLVAMDKRTGKVLWENNEPIRPDSKPGKPGKSGFYGSWSDPLPRVIDGQMQLFMSWPFRMCSLDPATGREHWTCEGLNPLFYTSPLYSDGIVIGMGGYSGMALAVKVGGKGDVTESHRLWHQEKNPQRIASGAIHEGHIYILNDPGIAQCINVKTGKEIWNERLKGPGPTGQNWSSIVISKGNCYAVNQGGDAFVFKASPKFEVLATNPMGEKVIGSIAVSDGQLFIRGHKHLFCVGKK